MMVSLGHKNGGRFEVTETSVLSLSSAFCTKRCNCAAPTRALSLPRLMDFRGGSEPPYFFENLRWL